MSKLEELIQHYCPDGVEYVRLGDVLSVNRGKRLTKTQLSDDGKYFVYHGSKDTPLGKYSQFNVKGKTTIVVNTGGIGGVKFCDENFWCSDGSFWIGHSSLLNDKYVYYYLSPKESYFASQKRVGGVPTIDRSTVENVEIPVPPLPVQEEIVRILDAFTELQAELQAELQKRKQQYNYYRDYLLSFEGRTDVEWKKLGEIASIKTGRRFVRTDTRESGVPCFHYGDIYTYYGLTATQTKGYLDEELAKKLRFAQPNDVVVVCAGENDMDIGVGVAWLGDEPAVVHDACCILHHNQSPRYISHFLRTHNYHLQMKKYVKNGKISSLPASGLAEALIPLPSFEEQERIAAILDRFDRLTNDLTSGLPAEIEKRRQQYEYYRDKLLTFKRKGA